MVRMCALPLSLLRPQPRGGAGAAEFLQSPAAAAGGSEDGVFRVAAALGTLVHDDAQASIRPSLPNTCSTRP